MKIAAAVAIVFVGALIGVWLVKNSGDNNSVQLPNTPDTTTTTQKASVPASAQPATQSATQPVAQPQSQSPDQAQAQPQPQPQQPTNQPTQSQTPMGLDIKTTQQGTGDQVTKAGDSISVTYTGKLTDGSVFDSTDSHGGTPFTFTLGQGSVIKGWDQGLLGMKVGEERTLTIPADLGYGAQGQGPIPPNATLIFDVQLVSIK
jgi:FKBP-type peptidyl-prolyl cis-trans isomerase